MRIEYVQQTALGIPQLRGLILRYRHDPLAIGAEGRARERLSIADKWRANRLALGIPQPRCAIVRGGQNISIRSERDALDPTGDTLEVDLPPGHMVQRFAQR